MKLQDNQLKASFKNHQLQLGLWCALSSSYSSEIVAGSGYDWLNLDMEHSPNDLHTILTQLQALAAYPVEPVVRPIRFDKDLIKQYLDLGVRNLILPNVESAEMAQAIVAATRYPGRGIRGVAGQQRANRWGRVPNYHATADQQLCIMVQIESEEGVKNAKAIAQVEGIDAVFVGPNDLAASMGYLGQSGHATVQDTIRHIRSVIQETGKGAGILAASPADGHRYIEWGYTMVGIGSDQGLLIKASDDLIGQFRKDLSAKKA